MDSETREAILEGLQEALTPRFQGRVLLRIAGYRDKIMIWDPQGQQYLGGIFPKPWALRLSFNMGHFNDVDFDYANPALVEKVGDALDEYLSYVGNERQAQHEPA